MKIQRYLAQSTVSELESARGSLMTPGQVARAKAAPGQAAQQVASDIGNALLAVEDVRRRREAESDAMLKKRMDAQRKISFAKWKQKWEGAPETMADGTPSATAMREEWQTITNELGGGFQEFNDADEMENFRELWNLESEAYNVSAEDFINVRKDQWNQATAHDLYRIAIEANDYDFAKTMSSELLENGWITQTQFDAQGAEIEGARIGREVEAEVEGIRETYRIGGFDAAEEYLTAAIANPVADQDEQDAIVRGLSTELNRLSAVDRKEKVMRHIAFSEEKSRLRIAVEQGIAGTKEIEDFFRRAQITGDEKLMQSSTAWLQELYMASLSGGKQDLTAQTFFENAQRSIVEGVPGYVGPADAQNRKSMTSFVNAMLPVDLVGPERMMAEIDLIRVVGVPTESIHQKLEAGGVANAPNVIIEAAEIMNALRGADGRIRINDGLNEQQRARLMAVANEISAGVDPEAAARRQVESALFFREQPKMVEDHINQTFRTMQSEGTLEESFDDMWGRSGYADVKFFGGEAGVFNEEVARGMFSQYVYHANHAVAGRDPEAVLAAAQVQFEQSFPVTYVNGRPEIQYGGLGGEESRKVGEVLFSEYLKGTTFQGIDDGVRVVISPKEQEDISFRAPYKANGILHYHVYYKDAPLFSEDGSQSVRVQVDEATSMAYSQSQKAEQRAEYMKEIESLEAELELQQVVPARTVLPVEYDVSAMQGMQAKEDVRDIPKEIELLRVKINELGLE